MIIIAKKKKKMILIIALWLCKRTSLFLGKKRASSFQLTLKQFRKKGVYTHTHTLYTQAHKHMYIQTYKHAYTHTHKRTHNKTSTNTHRKTNTKYINTHTIPVPCSKG